MELAPFKVNLLAKVARHDIGCGGGGCPALFQTSRGTYVIIGVKLNDADQATISKAGDVIIAADEGAVEIPGNLLQILKNML